MPAIIPLHRGHMIEFFFLFYWNLTQTLVPSPFYPHDFTAHNSRPTPKSFSLKKKEKKKWEHPHIFKFVISIMGKETILYTLPI